MGTLTPVRRGNLVALAAVAMIATGCTTMNANEPALESHQFDPVPLAEVGREDLKPIEPRSTNELLTAALDALDKANEAQENGDHEGSLQYYTLMLELLIEADLDPDVFYSLRSEFGKIIDVTTEKTLLAKRDTPQPWRPSETPGLVQSDIPIPDPLPERVAKQRDKILKVYPTRFHAGLERSQKYAPYIQARLKEEGLPKDLMWLAMVESQFYSKARSRAGAVGMWQFMASTGRRYDLRVDHYVDERMDWQKSTDAALAYLKDLYNIFGGNWPLAVTAYNKGERGLEKAITAGGGERNLWRLLETAGADRHLRLETKEFYPKLCASILVANSPGAFGFEVKGEEGEDVVVVAVKGSYDLQDLDRASGLPSGTLKTLNPKFLHGCTPPDGTSTVMVPTARKTQFASALNTVTQLKPGFHIVKRGDTVSQIASRYHVGQSELMRVNKISSPKRLRIGQRLMIPGVVTRSSSGGTAVASTSTGSDGRKVYTVRSGDCLSDIAKSQRVSVSNLQQWNNLTKSRIYVGQKLKVSAAGAAPASAPPKGEKRTHVVAKNECIGTIAEKYGVSQSSLMSWNKLTKRSVLRVGQKLAVYGGASASSGAAPSANTTHKVAKGENPWIIAEKYGVSVENFLAWNSLNKKSVLHVGDEYRVAGPASAAADSGPKKIVHVVARGQNPTTIAKRYGVSLSDLFEWNGWSKAPVLQIGNKIVVYK
ncbi:MAG: LysM peptidoglycan-binding domain-containing protein [bacterium]|nr:LysM peptidoglycan-binding domain-containing protein [bacterium]